MWLRTDNKWISLFLQAFRIDYMEALSEEDQVGPYLISAYLTSE